MANRMANVTVITEVGFCPFCARTRNLRREERRLGGLVRTTIDCESCHRTLSSTIGPPAAAPEPAAEPKPTPRREPAKAAEPKAAPAKKTSGAAAKKRAGTAGKPASASSKPAAKKTATRKK